jgi:SAM-dependent methyltransferase
MRIPRIFTDVPGFLAPVIPQATEEELAFACEVRRAYVFEGWQDPYMVDICRAFRLLKGARIYAEIGTRDKGNLAWVSSLMAEEGRIVDVDIEEFPEHEARLREHLGSAFEYHCILGDSVSEETIKKVADAIGDAGADAIFCDSSHMYAHTLAEFDSYFELVRPGGFLMFHDVYWEGSETHKGKAQALAAIDRYHPVWVGFMNEPVHRFLPRSQHHDAWGGVAIIQKPVA